MSTASLPRVGGISGLRATFTGFYGLERELSEIGYTLVASEYAGLFSRAGGGREKFVDLILAAEGFDPATICASTKLVLLTATDRWTSKS
jgi:hypothetical protein